LELWHAKICPDAIFQLKENQRKGKTSNSKTGLEAILEVKRAQSAKHSTANNDESKGKPPTDTGGLTSQPLEQKKQTPTSEEEKNDEQQINHFFRFAGRN